MYLYCHMLGQSTFDLDKEKACLSYDLVTPEFRHGCIYVLYVKIFYSDECFV